MSSEMRELVRAELRAARDTEDGVNRVMALLARTEAGADGWHKAVLDACMQVDGCYIASDPAKTVSNLTQWWYELGKEVTPTHPQDASGDAERTKYEELIYAVGNKYPGETRHETALRYIRQAESRIGSEASAAMQAKEAK